MDAGLSYSCAKCGQPPEDLLVMSCSHNLCLPCAAKNLAREQGKGLHANQLVVCDICGMETVLDPASAVHLLKLLPERLEEHPPRRGLEEELVDTMEKRRSRHTFSAPREMCRDHPDEEVYYFCFTCECECICAECAVHGDHRGHEVQTIKKAAITLRAKVEDLALLLDSRLDSLGQIEQKVEIKKKDLEEQSMNVKQQVSRAFEEMRQRLEKKEREVLEAMDLSLEDRRHDLDTYNRMLEQKSLATIALRDTVKRTLQTSSPEVLLNFYATAKDRIYGSAEGDRSEIQQIDHATDAKTTLEVSPVLERLKGLQAQVSDLTSLGEASRPESFQPDFGTVRSRPTANSLKAAFPRKR